MKNTVLLIKLYRHITGVGLVESKNVMDVNSDSQRRVIPEKIVKLFKSLLVYPYIMNKDEFMSIIEVGIDGMEALQYTDMLEATLTLLTNIKKHGGLTQLSQDRQEILDSI